MSVKFEWNGPRVSQQIRTILADRVSAASRAVAAEARAHCPVAAKGRPGHPVGVLRDSIAAAPAESRPERIESRVVVSAAFGRFVHEGTRHKAANPFLARALVAACSAVTRILGGR